MECKYWSYFSSILIIYFVVIAIVIVFVCCGTSFVSIQVDLLLMQNKTYAAEVAHAVSAKKRVAIVERAKILGVQVTNAFARVRVEEA